MYLYICVCHICVSSVFSYIFEYSSELASKNVAGFSTQQFGLQLHDFWALRSCFICCKNMRTYFLPLTHTTWVHPLALVASGEVMLKKVANSVGWVRALGWSPSSTRNPTAAWQGLMREWGFAIAKSFPKSGLSSHLHFQRSGVSLAVRWGVDSVVSYTHTYIYMILH